MSKLKPNSLKSLYQFYYGYILDSLELDGMDVQRTLKRVDEQRISSGYPLFSSGTINLLLKQVDGIFKEKEVVHE